MRSWTFGFTSLGRESGHRTFKQTTYKPQLLAFEGIVSLITPMGKAKYPSVEEIRELFRNYEAGGDPEKFWSKVSDDVEWLVQ
jgi:hypothetical protein